MGLLYFYKEEGHTVLCVDATWIDSNLKLEIAEKVVMSHKFRKQVDSATCQV